MRTDKPILLLVHSDPWARNRLTQEVLGWSMIGLNVIAAASRREVMDAIKRSPKARELIAIVIADGKLIDGDGEQFLLEIKRICPGASLALLTKSRTEVSSNTIQRIQGTSDSIREEIKPLYAAWRPLKPRVVVTGPKDTGDADALTDFLYRNSVVYDWSDESGRDLTVAVDGRRIRNWTLERLFNALDIFPRPSSSFFYHPYDVVIIGAGPAGLSAALSASVNSGFSTLLIESNSPGGTAVTSINPIDNYLGFPHGISGTRLAGLAIEQVRDLAQVDFAPMLRAQYIKQDFHGRYRIGVSNVINNKYTEVSAGMVLLACGTSPNRLNLKLPRRGVYYAALPCDQQREKGKEIVVVGGGNSAAMAVLQFAEDSDFVYMVAAKGFDRMSQALQDRIWKEHDAQNIEVIEGWRVQRFVGDPQLTQVKLKSVDDTSQPVRRIKVSSAYILIGGKPDTKWLHPDSDSQALGAEKVDLNIYGCIKTDHHLRPHRGKLPFETNLPGVFAAGDVRVNALRRVGQAVGQGAAAIASMETYAAEHSRVLRDLSSPAYKRFSIIRLVP